MASDKREIIGRDEHGRFRPGCTGTGRPKGALSKGTIDLREIRNRIVQSWGFVNGDKLLRELAVEKPEAYLKLVASLLPKPIDGDLTGTQIIIVVRSDAGMAFARQLQETARQLPALEAPQVIEALRATPVDLDFDRVPEDDVAEADA